MSSDENPLLDLLEHGQTQAFLDDWEKTGRPLTFTYLEGWPRQEGGQRPWLVEACRLADVRAVAALLKAGADPNAGDQPTPASSTHENSFVYSLPLFRVLNARNQAVNAKGQRVHGRQLARRQALIVDRLLKAGALKEPSNERFSFDFFHALIDDRNHALLDWWVNNNQGRRLAEWSRPENRNVDRGAPDLPYAAPLDWAIRHDHGWTTHSLLRAVDTDPDLTTEQRGRLNAWARKFALQEGAAETVRILLLGLGTESAKEWPRDALLQLVHHERGRDIDNHANLERQRHFAQKLNAWAARGSGPEVMGRYEVEHAQTRVKKVQTLCETFWNLGFFERLEQHERESFVEAILGWSAPFRTTEALILLNRCADARFKGRRAAQWRWLRAALTADQPGFLPALVRLGMPRRGLVNGKEGVVAMVAQHTATTALANPLVAEQLGSAKERLERRNRSWLDAVLASNITVPVSSPYGTPFLFKVLHAPFWVNWALAHGAKATDTHGFRARCALATALAEPRSEHSMEVLRFLGSEPAAWMARDNRGDTALHVWARESHLRELPLDLIPAEALHALDAEGRTAIDVALARYADQIFSDATPSSSLGGWVGAINALGAAGGLLSKDLDYERWRPKLTAIAQWWQGSVEGLDAAALRSRVATTSNETHRRHRARF